MSTAPIDGYYPGLLGIWDFAREVRLALLASLDAAVVLSGRGSSHHHQGSGRGWVAIKDAYHCTTPAAATGKWTDTEESTIRGRGKDVPAGLDPVPPPLPPSLPVGLSRAYTSPGFEASLYRRGGTDCVNVGIAGGYFGLFEPPRESVLYETRSYAQRGPARVLAREQRVDPWGSETYEELAGRRKCGDRRAWVAEDGHELFGFDLKGNESTSMVPVVFQVVGVDGTPAAVPWIDDPSFYNPVGEKAGDDCKQALHHSMLQGKVLDARLGFAIDEEIGVDDSMVDVCKVAGCAKFK
ncbi:hypothetical protein BDZ97DRAFT_1760063 [Flammula alnicola]|nr:hypothetical protein BDZ97DRAFT_1760063 [Flammula alnicola]